MRRQISKRGILEQIINLGVQKGDIVFIAADLLRVGYYAKSPMVTYSDWIDILIEAVGFNGTLVIPAYSDAFLRHKKNKDIVFSRESLSTSGGLSLAFQRDKRTVRSKHPTNSCFAIGKYAEDILDKHDHTSSSYAPYRSIVELGGKNLMLGAFSEYKLAPMAMHCAQEALGLTSKHWAAGLIQTYYQGSDGRLELFTRWDVGGCTAGGYKAIGHHVIENAIRFGMVGGALSAYIDCRKSYDIYKRVLNLSPSFLNCDNTNCPTCYGSPIFNHPVFWTRELGRYLYRKILVKQ